MTSLLIVFLVCSFSESIRPCNSEKRLTKTAHTLRNGSLAWYDVLSTNYVIYCIIVVVSPQAKYPAKYIYEPWLAPIELQRSLGCVIGIDYPARIVVHEIASKENLARMSAAYANRRTLGNVADDEDGADVRVNSNNKKKRKLDLPKNARDNS